MVTAILPCMTQVEDEEDDDSNALPSNARPSSPSQASDATITPSQSIVLPDVPQTPPDPISVSSRLAGFVGMFTGMGALIALVVFLPLPAKLTSPENPRSEALVTAYTIVGAMALFVASLCSFGLANLPGEKNKRAINILSVFRTAQTDELFPPPDNQHSSPFLLLQAFRLAAKDRTVLLAYVAGFVARASSVAISLFIPLLVNASFVASGRCTEPDGDVPGQWKDNCKSAYVVASMLTGVSQLVALLCAPAFGFIGTGGRRRGNAQNGNTDHNVPWALLVAAGAGVVGYILIGSRKLDLDFDNEDTHRQVVWSAFVVVMLLGFSQIGAIVCSLALLARAVQQQTLGDGVGDDLDSDDATTLAASSGEEGDDIRRDTAPLLGRSRPRGRLYLKGSMAGVYSLAGGAGILILTKLGGWLFDQAGWGWPFYLMAGFNAILLAVGLVCAVLTRKERQLSELQAGGNP
jgi:MFS family permease